MNTHSPKLVLNFATGSVSFPFSRKGAEELKTALDNLMVRLQQSATAAPGTLAQEPLDFWRREERVSLEVFCNPNIWPSPHAAKGLITLKTEQLRLSSETELPRLMEDLGQFLEQGERG